MSKRAQFLNALTPLIKLPANVEDECPICTDEFLAPIQLPCKHVFCQKCITEWLSRKTRNSCPYCRAVLFALPNVDRGPVGDNRLRVLGQAMEYSRPMTDDRFDSYDDSTTLISDIQTAAAGAYTYLREEDHSPNAVDNIHIDIQSLRPHIIAMANLLRGYARARGRPYSLHQRRDWRLIVEKVMTLLAVMDKQSHLNAPVADTARNFREYLGLALRADSFDMRSGRFFARGAGMESPNGDLEVLVKYVFWRATVDWKEKVGGREELRRRQREALEGERSVVGWALRWAGQRVFGGV